MSRDTLHWERDGADWPNREASRFIEAGGLRWHVQVAGVGPDLLLVHGTAASTHSWRGLLPLLARHFRVVAPDLPGHAFTSTPPRQALSLEGMAAGLQALLETLEVGPTIAVGHSAGAAILLRMCVGDALDPAGVISLNGALLPFRGLQGRVMSPIAKLLFDNSVAPRFVARRAADPKAFERLLGGTGSIIDEEGRALYARLTRTPSHVAAALGMMAHWDLVGLERALAQLDQPLVLVAGVNDRMVRPGQAARIRRIVPNSEIIPMKGLGHLAHEEQPELVAALIVERARRWSVLAQ